MALLTRLLAGGLTLALLTTAYAAEDTVSAQMDLLSKESEAVSRGQTTNELTRREQHRRLAALDEQVTPLMLEQAKLDVEEARLQFEGTRIDLQTAQRQHNEIAAKIAKVQAQLQQLRLAPKPDTPDAPQPSATELERTLGEQQRLEGVESKRVAVREEAVQAADERLRLARQWLEVVAERYRRTLEETQQDALDDLRGRLAREQQSWLSRAADWRRTLEALDSGTPEPKKALIQARIRDAEERAQIASREIRFAEVEGVLASLQLTEPEQQGAPALKSALDQLTAMREEVKTAVSLLTRRLQVLQQQSEVLDKRHQADKAQVSSEERRLYANLAAAVNRQHARGEHLLTRFEQQPERFRAAYEQSVRRSLAAHRTLPASRAEWMTVARDFADLPATAAGAFAESVSALGRALVGMAPARKLILFGALFTWFAAAFGLRRLLDSATTRAPGIVQRLAALPAEVLRHHGSLLTGLGAAALLVWLAAPTAPASTLLGGALLALVFTILLNDLNRAFFAAPGQPAKGKPRLYRQLKWLVVSSVTLGLVTLIGHSLTLSAVLVDLLDRLFMLSLLLFTIPVLEARRLLLAAMARRYGERYWMRVMQLLSLLAPLAVIATASIGIAGYVNLARAIGGVLAVVFGLLAAWLIANRLLREGRDLVAALVLRRSPHGLIWVKALIEPSHTLVRLMLFFGIWGVPLYLHGIGPEAPAVAQLGTLLQEPLFAIGRNEVSPATLLIAAIGVIAVLRGGRWLRNMTYRWAYAGVTDQGIRHSLSVFTHYGFVLVGLFILLQFMGIDLTTLAIFAGALGVGIGFGLQNIANNFISGILLLLERPLRTHDIVRVGEHEGEVTHIGMRSITVRTWDNQEVIMPNADVISNAFTNWTHHDQVVRTVVHIRVGYDSDPRSAKRVLEAVLAENRQILNEPHPEVWLREFSDSALLFHVQYFTDLTRSNRLAVRSEVLLAIWDGLRNEGIHIPRPQLEIRLPPDGGTARDGEVLPISLAR